MKFTEPVKNQTLEFAMIPRSKLQISPYQRSIASALVNKLTTSMGNGFIDPLKVVENGENYLVVDGQHRIAATDKILVDYELPCIILPQELMELPLMYNVEQKDNIRDISSKVYHLYCQTANTHPEWEENQLGKALLYTPHYATLSFAYMENSLGSPSLVEATVKKLDKSFFQLPLSESIGERREMAREVRQLEGTVYETADEWHIKDYNLKMAILSKTAQSLWGRKRPDCGFSEGIALLIEEIKGANWSWMAGR